MLEGLGGGGWGGILSRRGGVAFFFCKKKVQCKKKEKYKSHINLMSIFGGSSAVHQVSRYCEG